MPVELLAHWRAGDNWWLGGGVRKAFVKFSAGLVLEAEYMMSKNWGLKMRAVKEKGLAEGDTEKFSGDHVGAILTYYFD